MLRHFANARLATKHSPLAEQRLVYLRKETTVAGENSSDADAKKGLIELSKTPEQVARKIGRETRSHLGFLNDAAGININTLTEAEAEALTVKHVDVMQSQEPDVLREDIRTAVTRVLTASDAKEGSVLEMSRETRAMLDDLEQVDWKQDAAIAAFYDRRAALIRKILNLPETGVANKTDLALRLRYLPEVDEVLADRKKQAEETLSKQRDAQLDNAQVRLMVDELATLNWQSAIETSAALSKYEATLAKLLAPQTLQTRFDGQPYAQLKWALEQLPELQTRIDTATREKQLTEYAHISAEHVDVSELTQALAQVAKGDVAGFEAVYDEHEATLRGIFARNQTPVPPSFDKTDVITWAIQAVPGMAAAIEAERAKHSETREFDEPGCQYLNRAEYLEQYNAMIDRDTTRSPEEAAAMKENPPSAFQFRNTVYFNIDDQEAADPVRGPRSVAHELTHFAVRKERKANARFFEQMQAELETAGNWEELKGLVLNVFGHRSADMKDSEILEEALAIYMGGEKMPYVRESQDDNEANSWRIHQILAAAGASGGLALALRSIATEVDVHYDGVRERLETSTERSRYADKTAAEYEADAVRTNAEEKKTVKQKIGDTMDEKEGKLQSLGDIKGKITESQGSCESIRATLPSVRAATKRLDTAQRKQDEQDIGTIESFLGECESDLAKAAKYTDALERWDLPEKQGGLTEKEKEFFRKEMNFGPDDTTNKIEAQKALAKYVAGIETAIKEVNTFMTKERPKEARGNENKSPWKMLKEKLFTSGNGVEWVSWSDAVKIIGIFKDAILQKWEQGKERKAHRIADNLAQGAWIAKPIEYTLKKQARAANEKQTSEFADYLKTAGLNYDRLIGKQNGLFWRLGNINEKRAVLEFAAEKGWLYDLSPVYGNDVYGVNFIKEFGPEAYSDLVQHYEEGKKKEEKRGYAKVDKRPDIPPMIEDLKHELAERNLFAIKGIFERIQQKAKYAYSHVWALTTFVNELRKDPQLLEILDKGLLDDLGNIGIGQSAWSLTMFKILRDPLMEWKDGANWDNNVMTRTIKKIEGRLARLPGGIKEKTKEEAVAKIMAGQTYRDGDVTISIFQSDFDDYRKWWMKYANTTASAAKTDDDFFSPDGSDILLAGSRILEEIGTRDSTGRPTHQAKSANFFAMVINRYDDLKKADPIAKERYRSEMQIKLKNWFRTRICSNAASTLQFPEENDIENRNILRELLRRKILLKEDIIAGLGGNMKKTENGVTSLTPFGQKVEEAVNDPV